MTYLLTIAYALGGVLARFFFSGDFERDFDRDRDREDDDEDDDEWRLLGASFGCGVDCSGAGAGAGTGAGDSDATRAGDTPGGETFLNGLEGLLVNGEDSGLAVTEDGSTGPIRNRGITIGGEMKISWFVI